MTSTQRGILSRRLEGIMKKESISKKEAMGKLVNKAISEDNENYLNLLGEYEEKYLTN